MLLSNTEKSIGRFRQSSTVMEYSKPQFRHNELIVDLDDSITPSVLGKLKQLSKGVYLKPKELEFCDTRGFLNALEDKCYIGVGRYDNLKELLKKAGVARLVQDVEKAEDDIKEMERTVFHDDPAHVKAFKVHYDDICATLRKGSTFADVTEILKRQKILGRQHQIVGPTPLAARELLNIVMDKRNKGLRAMRVLACALWDAGHLKLACDILTTQYSWERGAGRDVRIPSSKRQILSGYLQITENLSEPDLDRVLDHLVSQGKVSEDERATILQQPSRMEKVQEMLDTVLSVDREGAGWALMDGLAHAGQHGLASVMMSWTISWMELELLLVGKYKTKILSSSSLNRDNDLDVRRGQQLPRMAAGERVTSWNVSDSGHGELTKTAICGQWAFSSDEPGQREWRGHKAVIDVETVEEVLGDHARKGKQTAQETLASIPDLPESSLFILNAMKRPDLKKKWKCLLSGECFPGAKVLLFEGSDGKAVPLGAVKRNVKQGCNLAELQWSHLGKILSDCYRDKLRNISISDGLTDLVSRKRRMSTRSQATTLPRMRLDERVFSWEAMDSEHGELLKTVICWQWANSSNEPGQREWGGHKAVIDLEILDDISGESKETVLKVLDVIPDETLFILNTMTHQDLKTKWSLLLSGKLLPDAKVLLIEERDGEGMSRDRVKRKQDSTETSGEPTGDRSAKKQRSTIL
ncbi:uncharacterized protein LOC106151255 isoform X1 [Lingula anatina]|uniref:Uncharacterized protein LOC106151255 isoform X1 n=1 Tax=Lingula anatina TaxID=7574 RepID=A0A1S3H1P9_LINAN|nr:uncharacterized protein LOC106151255 isoform X1 [Lingula anatina]XP_013379860.1 uncharacterized protein LOC106151255 isoform X1 [Lingula anatina]XP_013379861.1 uncharacterized protein LOC106151255 isoform X1 [Lingula anatina]XP_013379862.1 uncharacterized protein LOC106151255 isoform X1 [Lingula anatina]|eukprot:XP_013379859.1 uncharacterized protein LOC106151255 isoform X1 [Lingula anatina]